MKKTLSAHAVIFSGDKVLVVRRSKTDVRRPLQWDLPGGILEKGEELAEGCAREVQEESGIIIEPKELHLAYTTTSDFPVKGSVSWFIYVASTSDKEVQLSDEHDLFKWVTLPEATELIEYERFSKALRHIKETNLTP